MGAICLKHDQTDGEYNLKIMKRRTVLIALRILSVEPMMVMVMQVKPLEEDRRHIAVNLDVIMLLLTAIKGSSSIKKTVRKLSALGDPLPLNRSKAMY